MCGGNENFKSRLEQDPTRTTKKARTLVTVFEKMVKSPNRRIRPAISAAAAVQKAEEQVQLKREAQVRKERFLMFCKALCQDLKRTDPALYARTKSVILDCTDKKKQRVPGFDFETNMRTRLFDTVGEANWRRVERDLNKKLAQRETDKRTDRYSAAHSSSANSSTVSMSSSSQESEQRSGTMPLVQHVEQDHASLTMSSSNSAVELALGPVDIDDLLDGHVGPVDIDELEALEAEAKVGAFISNGKRKNQSQTRKDADQQRYIYI